MVVKNPCGKMVKLPYKDNAYEVWSTLDDSWKWYVLKKYQADDSKQYARWFTLVESPFTSGGELGDTYASEVMNHAVRIK